MDLFSPINLKGIECNNRAVMAPMVLNLAEVDGSVTEASRDFYLARARGGVSYIDTVLGPFDSFVIAVRYRGDAR